MFLLVGVLECRWTLILRKIIFALEVQCVPRYTFAAAEKQEPGLGGSGEAVESHSSVLGVLGEVKPVHAARVPSVFTSFCGAR